MVDSALKRLAGMRNPGTWLLSRIDGVLESSGESRSDPGWFHPSDLSHPCDAYLAFKYLGAPSVNTITARVQRIFDLGNARDVSLKDAIQATGTSLIKRPQDRKIVIPLYHIRGEIDEWVENPLSKERFIVDIKTMHDEAWKALEEAKPEHVIQMHPYMFAKETYQALLLYENKNNQEHKMKLTKFINNIWQQGIVERIERVLEGLSKGYVNRTPIPNDSSCPFYGICSSNRIAELKERSGLFNGS